MKKTMLLMVLAFFLTGQSALIDNNTEWKDILGNEIKAQGGCILQDGKTFHWIGPEFESENFNFRAINHYTSTDLQKWTKQSPLLTPDMAGLSSISVYATSWVGRPWVMKHDTNKYVMWIELGKLSTSTYRNRYGIFHASAISGPWTIDTVYSSLPDGVGTHYGLGDLGAYHDLFTGNAYLLYTFDKNEANGYQAIVKLSPDFRRVLSPAEGGVIAEFPKPGSNCREAAAMFKRGTTYYYIMSETRGWRPSTTWYRTASRVGPVTEWSALLQVAVTPAGDAYSFRTQHDFVLPFTGSSTTTYIYCGDRWSLYGATDYNGALGRQAWFPLTFDANGAPTINAPGFQANGGDWFLDTATGAWSATTAGSSFPGSRPERMIGVSGTSIYYSVPQKAFIKISILGMDGITVRTLENSFKMAGNHSTTWDGKTDNGFSVTAGTYVLYLRAGTMTASSKAVYLR